MGVFTGTKDEGRALRAFACTVLGGLIALPLFASAPAWASQDEAFSAADFARLLEERGEQSQKLLLADHPELGNHPELEGNPDLWHLYNFGQDGGKPGADIDWLDAMALDVRDPRYDNRVGVIDTGVSPNHPELAGRICQLEVPGNGRDDDGNGFTDDAYGWDFLERDSTPWDDSGHGTFVAGLIAANDDAEGGMGAIGVAREACVVPIRVIGVDSGKLEHLLAGIRYAARLGLPVVNISLATQKPSQVLAREVARARARGTLIVAAAGNDGKDIDNGGAYPAALPHDNVVTVGASTDRDFRASFSNYGKKAVDLLAPGRGVVSTEPGNKVGIGSGTSFAAPLVAGAASELLRSAPQLGPAGLRGLLMRGVEIGPNLDYTSVSGGRLSLFRSLQLLPQDRETSPPKNLRAKRLGRARGSRNQRRKHRIVRFTWKPGERGQRFVLVVDGQARKQLGAGKRRVQLRLGKSKHTAWVIGIDRAGNEARSEQIRFR